MNNPLVEKYGKESRWLTWKLETRKGKTTKVPYQTNGKLASSTDKDTWTTYESLKEKKKGIVLKEDRLLICVDMDHVLDEEKKIIVEEKIIKKFLIESNSYTEVSQSGSGLHVFLALEGPLTLEKNKHQPFEIYSSGRYIAVTENAFGKMKDVRTIPEEEAIALLSILGYPWKPKEEKKKATSLSPLSMDDATVLQKMFTSKNGPKIRALYDGDISQYGNDASSADMALCSHLAFWTGKNVAQMDSLWTSSQLGSRKKVQERKDYRDRTITMAISSCTEVYENKTIRSISASTDLDLLFVLNKDGGKIFIQNTENICRVLRHHPDFKDKLRYDRFKNVLQIHCEAANYHTDWRTIEDNDAVNIQTSISILFPCFGKVGKLMAYDAIIKVAKENSIDSAIDYIKTLKWDGVSRIDSWLSEVYGVEKNAYFKAVGSNWLKGLVKRIVMPGSKFDYVLVLEGPQGSKKSTSLGVLGGDWHVETTMSTDSKDFFMQMQGKAIIEFSEGETLNRTEVKKMKAIITMQNDKYRPPYERTSQDFPRRCVFAMTTNQEEYLKDETGNRRWLPVAVVFPEANVEWLVNNRDQLFAEAYERVIVKKETVYEFPKEETLAAQQARRITDPNADAIAHWYFEELTEVQRETGITTQQVHKQVLNGGFSGKSMAKYEEMNIGEVLKSIGLDKRRIVIGGHRYTKWFKKGTLVEVELPVKVAVNDDGIPSDWATN